MKVYVVGSLKHPRARDIAYLLREAGHDVFDAWSAVGPEADRYWQEYEQERGLNYAQALIAPFAHHGFEFDRQNLVMSDAVVAVTKPNSLPGISSVAELGFMKLGLRKPAYVLLDGEPQKWDLMLPLVVDKFFYDIEELLEILK